MLKFLSSTQISLSYHQVPETIKMYTLDITVKQGKQKLREEFYKNAHVRDPRVIDMLVIKVQLLYAMFPQWTIQW